MPITADVIKQSEALADLPEDKVEAFVKLATNVFTEDIANHTGASKRRWEEDIKTLYGADKPDPKMPAHEFLKTAWTERENKFKEELAAAKQNPSGVEELEAKYKNKIAELETQLKNGALQGSELLKQDLEGYKNKVKDLEALAETLKKDQLNERKKWEQDLLNERKNAMLLELNYERQQAISGLEFKHGLDETDIADIVETRWNKILSEYTPERVKDEHGKTITQWRDRDGNIARNPNNNREPYTTKELLVSRLATSLRQGRTANGTGTNGGAGGSGLMLDLQSARTQVEADNAIKQHLIAKGHAVGTSKYQTEFDKIRDENKDLFTGEKRLPLQ